MISYVHINNIYIYYNAYISIYIYSHPEVDRIWKIQNILTKVGIILRIPLSIYSRVTRHD